MKLPDNKRRVLSDKSNDNKIIKKTLWVYGKPFSGKTTFANTFPDPLMLNTDGNIKFVDSPYILVKDEVVADGRLFMRKLAWEIFKDIIIELEKKQNTYKTIVIDLVEDLYEYAREYVYKQMNITHESDDPFRSWDRLRSEFLRTIKAIINLDYENIVLISHEDTTKDLTKRNGDKITQIKPSINEKTANKVAGIVDICARITFEGNKRLLNLESNEIIFGGGRLKPKTPYIPLNYLEYCKLYEV